MFINTPFKFKLKPQEVIRYSLSRLLSHPECRIEREGLGNFPMQKQGAFAFCSPEVILCFPPAVAENGSWGRKKLGSKSEAIHRMHAFLFCSVSRLEPPPQRFHVRRREGHDGLLARALRRELRLHPLTRAPPRARARRRSPAASASSAAAAAPPAPRRARRRRRLRAPSARRTRRRAQNRPERTAATSAPSARDPIQQNSICFFEFVLITHLRFPS